MNSQKIDEIDALILEEKKSIAREYFVEAWEAAIADGIDADLIAETMVEGSLNELASHKGDVEAAKLISAIRSMETNGEFLGDKTIQ